MRSLATLIQRRLLAVLGYGPIKGDQSVELINCRNTDQSCEFQNIVKRGNHCTCIQSGRS
jgi:hypothetical protein